RLAAEAKAARDGAEKARKDKKRGGGQDAANRAMAAGVGVGFARTFLGGLVAGIGVSAVAEVVRRTVAAAAEDEFERSQLRVSGNLTQAQMEEHRKLLERTARLRGVGTEGSYSTFGTLMDSGWSDKDAAAMTDSVIVFAKANRVATEEATELTSALRNNMKVSSAKEMMTAYDAISRGAKSGKMSAQDLARYLPGVLGGMQRLGEQGQTGVRNTVALLETVSMRLDSSREAAAGFEAVLGKLANPAFIKRAGKLGVNVEKTMRDANKKGVSPLFAVLKEIDRRTKGDPIKLGKLGFSKNEIAFLNAALKQIDEAKDKIEDMGKAGGETMKNYEVATNNATEAWKRLSATIGQDAKDLATDVLPGLTRAMDTFTQQLERARTQKAGGEYEAPEDATYDEKRWVAEQKRKAGEIDAAAARRFGLPLSQAAKEANIWDAYEEYSASRRLGGRYEERAQRAEELKKVLGPNPWDPPETVAPSVPSSREGRADDGTPTPAPAPRDWKAIQDMLQKMGGSGGDGNIPIPTPAPREWQSIQDMLKGMDGKASDAGQATMDAYKAAMGAGLDATRAMVAQAVAQMREMLNFSASPTIVPHVATAAVAAGGGGGG
ncbi:MAG: phage tail tape measure protein, partial [Mesorhizobium sp.]